MKVMLALEDSLGVGLSVKVGVWVGVHVGEGGGII